MQACTELEINAVLWAGDQMIHTTQTWNIMDGLELLDDADKDSVTLMILDLPYYKVVKNGWDNQWKTLDDYLDWCKEWFVKSERVLKGNGSLYYFNSQFKVIKAVDTLIESCTALNFRQFITIDKGMDSACSYHGVNDGIRSYPNGAEYLSWYTFKDVTGAERVRHNILSQSLMGSYLLSEFQRAGVKQKELGMLFPSKTGGTKAGCITNWVKGYNFPLEWQYERLRDYLNSKFGGVYLNRVYENLKCEYRDAQHQKKLEHEDLRQEYEDLRYAFNYQNNSYNVWHLNFYKERRHGHPTQKPFDLIKRIVLTSSNEGDVVCDPAMGTGTTMKVCEVHNRNFIGAEIDPNHEPMINNRCMTHTPPIQSYF